MASDRAVTTGATAPAAAYGPASGAPARDATQASGGRCLKRAALYARVSTEKQEREETIASQVDVLYQTAAAHGYDVAPGSVFIDDGVSGTRLDRPALDR
jgi:predicted site-specific integrase-resolvase